MGPAFAYLRLGAARLRVEDGRFYLEEAVSVQQAADGRRDEGAGAERLPHLRVCVCGVNKEVNRGVNRGVKRG